MENLKLVRLFILLPLLALMTACASVTRGSMDTLVVNSTPEQADIKIYRSDAGFTAKEIKNNTVEDPKNPGAGPMIGTTPGEFKLARKGEYRVMISKDGYKTTEVEIGNRISGAGGAGMAGNVIAGGILGMVVDARTGATRDLTPNPVEVSLVQGDGLITIPLAAKEEEASEEDKEEEAPEEDKESDSKE